MTTPTDYPDRVRALVADAEPRPPLLPDGTVPTDSDGNCTTCGWKTAAYVPDGPDHGAGCPANQEHWRLGGARSALRYEAPTLARAYLAACEEVERLTRVLADRGGSNV